MATKQGRTTNFFPLIFCCCSWTGSGMDKSQDTVSGINIPDPQHCLRTKYRYHLYSVPTCMWLTCMVKLQTTESITFIPENTCSRNVCLFIYNTIMVYYEMVPIALNVHWKFSSLPFTYELFAERKVTKTKTT